MKTAILQPEPMTEKPAPEQQGVSRVGSKDVLGGEDESYQLAEQLEAESEAERCYWMVEYEQAS